MYGAIPDIQWAMDSLIVQGSRTVIYGEFGAMKSWLLLHLGLHLAAGVPWLGKFRVARPYRVLYIDEEMAESELSRRVKLISAGGGFEDRTLPFYSLSQVGLQFSPGGVEELARGVAPLDPEVIIVETLRRVIVGSENEASDVGAFWKALKPLLAGGRTFILSHHMKKPGASGPGATRHRASGSTDILAGSDASFGLKKSKEDNGTHVLTCECTKLRGAVEPPEFTMVVKDSESVEGVEVAFGDFVEESLPASKVGVVLALCLKHPTLTHSEIYKLERDNLKQLHISRATYYRAFLGQTCSHQGQTGQVSASTPCEAAIP